MSLPATETTQLDFWTFVEHAVAALRSDAVSENPWASEVLLALNRASDLITYDLESSIHRPRGFSWSAFRLLFVLWLGGNMESRKAARVANMSRATVSNVSGSLEERGYLLREVSAEDRRSLDLRLTPAGLELIRSLYTEQNRRETQWASSLTAEERSTLTRLLTKLIGGRDQMGARIRE